jgi:hypothetical protein
MSQVTIINTKDLAKAAQVEGLPQPTSEQLQAEFMPFFEAAHKVIEQSKSIKVQSASCTVEMKQARAARLQLKNIRVDVEKVRKSLKEDSLRTGKAIDGMANFLKFMIEPVEEYLDEQEKYGERLEREEREALRNERQEHAGKYLQDIPQSVDLSTIGEDEFLKLLEFAKAQFEAREETARRLEAERIERERREAEERAAMAAENERLRKEAEQREKVLQAERAEREREAELSRQREEDMQREIERERQRQRELHERIQREAEAKEMAERIERERLEKAEAKRLSDIESAKVAARVAAENASDLVKMEALVADLSAIKIPEFQRNGLKSIVATMIDRVALEMLAQVN